MGIIKETDNITLNVYWKGWKKSTQRADYISKIRNIINLGIINSSKARRNIGTKLRGESFEGKYLA